MKPIKILLFCIFLLFPLVALPKVMAAETPIVDGIGMQFVKIPAGRFLQGSPPDEPTRRDDEAQHEVTITRDFHLGAFEVTQAQWKAVMKNNPSIHRGDNLPVENITWDEAVTFCEALSRKTARRYRLPTEAEWEYACRAGSQGLYSFGNDSTLMEQYAWYNDGRADISPHPVGTRKPNAWGLYDMYGNVYEWCSDWWWPYSAAPASDPTGPTAPRSFKPDQGPARVARGGGWTSEISQLRSAYRTKFGNTYKNQNMGLRVVLEVEPMKANPQ